MHDNDPSLTPRGTDTNAGVRLDLRLKTQQALLQRVLPALLSAIDDVTGFMYEPDADDEEIHQYLREIATETVIDETVRLLTRDPHPVSRLYTVQDDQGIAYDTLIACYSELQADHVRAWFSQLVGMDSAAYEALVRDLPDHMKL